MESLKQALRESMMDMGSGTSGNRSAPDPRMEAVRKVQAHLSTFELPGQIRCSYAGATKQAGMLETHPVTDDNEFNVDVELRVAGRSGPVYARVPVPVRQGALLRPSVIFIDGQARMIAQSVFDDLRTMLTVDMSKQGQVQGKTAQVRGLSRGDLTWLYQQQKDPNSPAPEPAPSLPPKKVNVRVPPHKDNLTPWTDIIPEQFDAHSIFEAGGLQWQVTQVHPAESGNCYVLHAQSIDPGHPDLKRLDEFIAGDILWTVDDVRPWRRKLGNNLYGLIAYNLPTYKPKTATYSVDMSKQGQVQDKTAQAQEEPGIGSTLEQAQAYDKAGDVPNACVMYNRYRFEMRDAGQPVDPQVVQRYRYLHALMMEGSPEKAEAFLSNG